MKHIVKSQTYRETLADVTQRKKKKFSQLSYQTKLDIAQELGMDLNNKKDWDNISRCWCRHRTDVAMIKEAKEMVAVDKAATARAATAQASNNNEALMAATINANQAVGSLAGKVESLAGKVGDLMDATSDLKDIAFRHENRLTNVKGRMGVTESRQDAADGRMDRFEVRPDILSKARQQQQQPDPTAYFGAVSAPASGGGWASPCASPSKSSPANTATPPVFVVATKKTPTSPSTLAFGSFGTHDHDSGGGWASPCPSPSKSSPANTATPPVFVVATKKTPTSPSTLAFGSFGTHDHDSGGGWASPCPSPSKSSPANTATPPVFVVATKKTPTSPSTLAFGSFGTHDHDTAPRWL